MPSKIDLVSPASLSPPTGYSHVAIVEAGKQVHVSGQVAFDPMGKVVGEGDIAAQAERSTPISPPPCRLPARTSRRCSSW